VEKEALNVLEEFQIDSLPVEPTGLAKCKGYRVEYRDLSEENFRGVLSDRKIAIDSTIESSSMKRFIVAHELGHGVLGHGTSGYYNESSEYDVPCSEREAMANLFARALLMPKHYLQKAVEIFKSKDGNSSYSSCEEYLSDIFGVTERRVRDRLEECELGI